MKAALSGIFVAALASSCAISTASKDPLELPTLKSFQDNDVSLMMEQRCGTLDCHGQVGRPLRLYGQHGLRLAADSVNRAAGATTPAEQKENYLSVIGLEPELLAKVFKGGTYDNFQLLLKPQGLATGMRHKGGQVLSPTKDDDGWQCLLNFVAPIDTNSFKEVCDSGAAFH